MITSRKALRFAFDGVALVISHAYDSPLLRYIYRLNNRAYSFAIQRRLEKVGENFAVEYPAVLLGLKHVSIGNNFEARARLRLEVFDEHRGNRYTPEVRIGNNVSLNYDCHIGCVNKIEIGDNVLMGSRILITDHYHGEITAAMLRIPPGQRKVQSPGPVIIEDNVWIGEGVAIMPNVRIGRNAIIGANAVVTRDIPADSVAVGAPARVIRCLSEEQ